MKRVKLICRGEVGRELVHFCGHEDHHRENDDVCPFPRLRLYRGDVIGSEEEKHLNQHLAQTKRVNYFYLP